MPLVKISGILDAVGGGALTTAGAIRFLSGDPTDSMALFTYESLRGAKEAANAQNAVLSDSLKSTTDNIIKNQAVNSYLEKELGIRSRGNAALSAVGDVALVGAAAIPLAATGAAVAKDAVDGDDDDHPKSKMHKHAFLTSILSEYSPYLAMHAPNMLMALPAVASGGLALKSELNKLKLNKATSNLTNELSRQNALKNDIKLQNMTMLKNVGKLGLLASSVPISYYIYNKLSEENN